MSSVFDKPLQSSPVPGPSKLFAQLNTSAASHFGPPLHRQLLSQSAHEQLDCLLFQFLPAEIRGQIFALVLVDYEDPAAARQYSKDTCWTRPSYASPRKTDTALLQTCRSIYKETWFLPFVLKEQTHWITGHDRAPPEYDLQKAKRSLRQCVNEIKRDHEEKVVEIDSLRIFTQMFMLEDDKLAEFLEQFPDLSFRRLFITIRHADFWFWEDDEPLRFEGEWIPRVCRALPPTVREVIIEMETVKRKSMQLDDIANQMGQRWHFRTKDGKALFADSTANSHEVSSWQGSSIWHRQRWVRDEISNGIIEYYVGSVRFKPRHVVERAGGTVSDEALGAAASEEFVKGVHMKLHLPNRAIVLHVNVAGE
ncbi:hypothetical protein PWT90_02134 [Aphanocladium album]|nr:hypothetical protein PWT90_02134 [Aphanocladium album]